MARFEINFISYALQRSTDITVIIPSLSYPEVINGKQVHMLDHALPVLYLLHGIGNNHLQWCGYANVELYAEERMIAVVMISGENGFYINHGDHRNYETFLNEELPQFLHSIFACLSTRKEDTYIAGLSMGGFGALYHMLHHSERYKAVGAFSPAISEPQGNILDMTSKAIAAKVAFPALYLACGDEDFLYASNVNYHEYLDAHDIDHYWLSLPGYTHEWRFWDICIERFMDWLPRSDGYAGSTRKV